MIPTSSIKSFKLFRKDEQYLTALAKELFGDRIEAARERDLGQDKENIV